MEATELKKKIVEAFIESGLDPARAADLAFHMTDWFDDGRDLQNLYSNINEATHEDVCATLIKFLAHVPDHLAAAKKLVGLGSMTDVFSLGVLEQENENDENEHQV